jgi:hypothetical protein
MVALYPGGPRSRGTRVTVGAEVWEVAAELGVNVISIGGGTEELKEDEDTECLDPAMLGCTGGSGRWVGSRSVMAVRLTEVAVG